MSSDSDSDLAAFCLWPAAPTPETHGASSSAGPRASPEPGQEAQDGAVKDAAWWASEVAAVAKHLHELAALAPVVPAASRAKSSLTEISVQQLSSWEACADSEATLRELASLSSQAAVADEEACEAEAAAMTYVAEAQSIVRCMPDEAEAERKEHTASRLAVDAGLARLADGKALACIAGQASVRSARARSDVVCALRVSASLRATESRAAECDCRTRSDTRCAHSARETLARRARVFELAEECTVLGEQETALRCDMARASESAAARVHQLEAQSAKLEQECCDRQTLVALPGLSEVRPDVGHRAHCTLSAAHASSRELIIEVKSARAAQERVAAPHAELAKEVARLRQRCEDYVALRRTVELARGQEEEHLEAVRRGLDERSKELAELEERCRAADELTTQTRLRHCKLEEIRRGLTQERRQAEEKETVLRWMLHRAVTKLARQKAPPPGSRRRPSTPKAGMTGARHSTQTPSKLQSPSRRLSIGRAFRPAGEAGDPELSTTATLSSSPSSPSVGLSTDGLGPLDSPACPLSAPST